MVRGWLQLYFVLMLLAFCALILTFNAITGSEVDHSASHRSERRWGDRKGISTPSDWNYGIIVDAGSSGSRVYVYVWPPHSGKEGELLKISPLLDQNNKGVIKKVSPGLSSLGEVPYNATNYMGPLLDFAAAHIPPEKHKETSLFIMATAGLRLLPEDQREKILKNLRTEIPKKYDFIVLDQHIEMISGKWEGIYSWIAVNYALGRFGHGDEELKTEIFEPSSNETVRRPTTVGMIDMGGGSVQIAYEIDRKAQVPRIQEHLIQNINLGCTEHAFEHEYRLYVTTFLGFGANQAAERYEDALRTQLQQDLADSKVSDPQNPVLRDPCFPVNLVKTVRLNPHAHTTTVSPSALNTRMRKKRDVAAAENVNSGNSRNAPLPQSSALLMDKQTQESYINSAIGGNNPVRNVQNSQLENAQMSNSFGANRLNNAPIVNQQTFQNSQLEIASVLNSNGVNPQNPANVPAENKLNWNSAPAVNAQAVNSANSPANVQQQNINSDNLQQQQKNFAPASHSANDNFAPVDSPQNNMAPAPKTLIGQQQVVNSGGLNQPAANAPVINNADVKNQHAVIEPGSNNIGVNKPAVSAPSLNNAGVNQQAINLPVANNAGVNQPLVSAPTVNNAAINQYQPAGNAPGTGVIAAPVLQSKPSAHNQNNIIPVLTPIGNKFVRKGVGEWTECGVKLQKLLKKEAPCEYSSCSMNGIFQPPINISHTNFFGFSEYWYSMEDVLGIGGLYDYDVFRTKSTAFCKMRWSQIQKRWKQKLYPKADKDRVRTQCFKSAWVSTVLHDGFGIPRTVKHFKSVQNINGQEVQWTLGAILYKLRFFPLREIQRLRDMQREQNIALKNSSYFHLPSGYLSQILLFICMAVVLLAAFRYCMILRGGRPVRYYPSSGLSGMTRNKSLYGYMMLDATNGNDRASGIRIEHSDYVY